MDIDKAFEELYEGWKKGKYKVTDGKTGKVLATFNSGGKAQKYVDDIFQKGDYESLTVELDEEVEKEFAKFVEELDEASLPPQMKSTDQLKFYDKLKTGDTFKVWYQSSAAKGDVWREFKVTGKTPEKMTLQSLDHPKKKTAKFYLYNRGKFVSWGMNDRTFNVTSMKEELELDERKMTDGEKEEREEIVKKLKPKLQSFKDRYGADAKKVMYATATKQAMEEVEIDENKYDMFDDKPAQELDKEMKKAMKMKSYEVARAHIGDFLIKLDKKYPKSGVTDTEPRSIVTDMLNKKFRTKHKLHYADSSDELKSMKSRLKPPPSLRSLNITGPAVEEFELDEMSAGLQLKMAFDDAKIKIKGTKGGKLVIAKKDEKKVEKVIAKQMRKPADAKRVLGSQIVFEDVELDEGGHTDVASAKNQVKVARSALQKMEMELNKLPEEGTLPSWWTNKVAIAVDKLDGMADYLDTQVEEVEIEEAVLADKDYKYDGKVVKISKKNFSKVHKDFKGTTKGKETMLVLDPKSGGTILVPVQFEEMGNVAPTAPDSGGIQYQAPVLGQKKKKKKQTIDEAVQRTTFAGKDVFIVDSETYYNCRLGKKKYGRYEKYVGNGEVGQTIREYGLKYPRRPIILQNGESGPMLYLKYGRS